MKLQITNNTKTKKYFVTGLLIICMVMMTFSGCSSDSEGTAEGGGQVNDAAVNAVIEQFMALTEIPRQSGHEELVSDYLKGWAEERDLEVIQDENKNIIIYKDASEGYENAPRTIIQGHMDMVCIAADGVDYDPLTDPIEAINDGKTISTGEKTSLGADDGIGVAMILYALDNDELKHGPLTAIITVEEEDGVNGAPTIDSKYLEGTYMINMDSESSNTIMNSAAGAIDATIDKDINGVAPTKNTALQLSVNGLTGGHSGVEINMGHVNAIKAMAGLLLTFDLEGVDFELAQFNGGTARNAIASSAEAVIVIDSDDVQKVESISQGLKEEMVATYSKTEPDLNVAVAETHMPQSVMSNSDKEDIISFTSLILNGVHTMSQSVEGLVESSSNIGIVNADTAHCNISVYIRSSEELFMKQLDQQLQRLIEDCHMELSDKNTMPPWPVNPDSVLIQKVKEIYKAQNGEDISVEAIHAGLECAYFYEKNPELDIISIGPDLTDVHTPNETLNLETLPRTVNLFIETLSSLTE